MFIFMQKVIFTAQLFFEILQRYCANLLFLVLWAHLAMSTISDSANLLDTLTLSTNKKSP